jgi:hypothetical protein
MKKPIKIVKDVENPENVELLAKSIIKVAEAFETLLNTPLRQRAIEVLLHDVIGASKISRTQIRLVLENLPRLKGCYIKS